MLSWNSGEGLGFLSISCQIPCPGESQSCSVMSNCLWPCGLYSPRNSPGQNTGVGSLFLLQEIFPTQGSNPSLPHCRWILYQLSHKVSPRLLEWVACPFSRGSPGGNKCYTFLLHYPGSVGWLSCAQASRPKWLKFRCFHFDLLGNPLNSRFHFTVMRLLIGASDCSRGSGSLDVHLCMYFKT